MAAIRIRISEALPFGRLWYRLIGSILIAGEQTIHQHGVGPPMKSLLIPIVVFASFGVSFVHADEKPLFAPRPTKDPVASKNHAQGAGIFEMIVEKPSGKVNTVFVRSSTKNVLLDADVINTFLQWRFKPNTESSVKIVVLLTADKDEASYPVGPTMHATNRGIPYAFKDPIAPGRLWQWFSEFYGAAGHR